MDALLELSITALSHDGRGIARLPAAAEPHDRTANPAARGTVVFVRGALPGQEVQARISKRKANLWEAKCVRVLRPAEHQVPPLCPHQEECGGCPLQCLDYADQLYWKRELALQNLCRLGGLDAAFLDELFPAVTASGALTGFRNKMEFAFGPGHGVDSPLILGQRARHSARVLAVPHCVLLPATHTFHPMDFISAVAELATATGLPAYIAPATRSPARAPSQKRTRNRDSVTVNHGARKSTGSTAAQDHAGGFWRFLTLRYGQSHAAGPRQWQAICLTSPAGEAARAAVRRMASLLLERFPAVTAFIHEERATQDALALGQVRVAHLQRTAQGHIRELPLRTSALSQGLLSLPLGGHVFQLDAASFFQVNTAGADILARKALDFFQQSGLQRPRLLDLYCGAGAPGQLLAPHCQSLLGLEYDQRAVALATANAARAGLSHCRYLAGDAGRLLRSPAVLEGTWQMILADPPRAGLSPEALQSILQLAPHSILYISCNAAMLARDARVLRTAYSLEALHGVDLFPHTPHLECISLWRQRP